MSTGYIFNFTSHGCFSPDGKVADMTPEQIEQHNAELAQAELATMRETGRDVLYLFRKNGVL